jgi:membrane peptidoglycan carboxypeptidase
VADAVFRMMETVVSTEGTGRRAALKGVRVAGKTGTAQKLDVETGTYSTKSYLAWFAGVAPADDPRIVIVVMLDEPAGLAHTGGATAAPLFARVAAGHLIRHGILTQPELPLPRTASIHPDPDTPRRASKPEPAMRTSHPPTRGGEPHPALTIATLDDRLLLPDFSGLSTDEVMRATTRIGLEVDMQGRGHAVSQYPAPGTILAGTMRRVSVLFAPPGEGG